MRVAEIEVTDLMADPEEVVQEVVEIAPEPTLQADPAAEVFRTLFFAKDDVNEGRYRYLRNVEEINDRFSGISNLDTEIRAAHLDVDRARQSLELVRQLQGADMAIMAAALGCSADVSLPRFITPIPVVHAFFLSFREVLTQNEEFFFI